MSHTPTPAVYESIRDGRVAERVTGVSVERSPATGEADDGRCVWLVRTGPGHAPPGFKPKAGDRLRDHGRKWWAVKEASKPDADGVVTLTCTAETP